MSNFLKKTLQSISTAIAKTTVNRYVQKNRNYSYKGLHLKILAGVFHPGFYFSSKLLANWLLQQNINGKKVLELGAGSGLISLLAARNGAIATASDINPASIHNIQINAAINQLKVEVVLSDLFDDIPASEVFDIIIINPPYYPKNPATDYEKAWYCGEDYSYFRKLFFQLKERNKIKQVYMILADVCNIRLIKQIAGENGYGLMEVYRRKNYWETNFIFRIAPGCGNIQAPRELIHPGCK